MNRKSSKKQKRAGPGGAVPSLHGIAPNAAGIDAGAEIFVAVPQDRDPSPVRSFETLSRDPAFACDGNDLAIFLARYLVGILHG